LFIDQICINQSDIQERNQQVALMEAIYKSAEHVIVWLGLSFPEGELIVRLINSLAAGACTVEQPLSHHIKKPVRETFCELSYWPRLWIGQEFVLAKRLQLVLGEHTIGDLDAYTAIDKDFKLLDMPKDLSNRSYAGWQRMHCLFSYRRNLTTYYSFNSCLTWKTVGILIRGTKCQEKRDYVYGVMGVINPLYRIPVDYNISPL
jgi:hypothetical protein